MRRRIKKKNDMWAVFQDGNSYVVIRYERKADKMVKTKDLFMCPNERFLKKKLNSLGYYERHVMNKDDLAEIWF